MNEHVQKVWAQLLLCKTAAYVKTISFFLHLFTYPIINYITRDSEFKFTIAFRAGSNGLAGCVWPGWRFPTRLKGHMQSSHRLRFILTRIWLFSVL